MSCDYPSDGGEPAKEVDAPAADAPDTGEATAVIATSAGDVDITLGREATPCTVNSFVSLAEQGYFDDTECHRITTQGIFVLQCGDPSATGMGGPGYSFDDELTGRRPTPPARWRWRTPGPNTNGSQFFIVFDDSQLVPTTPSSAPSGRTASRSSRTSRPRAPRAVRPTARRPRRSPSTR